MNDFATARAKIGGLKGVMAKLNDAPPDGRWKPMTYCPFCKNKNSAGVFTKGGIDFFKCHNKGKGGKPACSTGGDVFSEVGYIAFREGLSDAKPSEGGASPAYRRFLEMADCWVEPEPPKPKKKDAPVRHNPVQTAPAPENTPAPLPNPVLPAESIAPPVAPAVPPAPAFELKQEPANPEAISEADMIAKCIEVVRAENKASASLFMRRLRIGFTRAERIVEELERRGIVGPSKGKNNPEPRDILKLPPPAPGLITVKIGDELHIENVNVPAATPAPASDKFKTDKPESREVKPDEKAKMPPGMAALRAFHEKLFPTESQMTPYLADGSRVPSPLPASVAKKLKFRAEPLFVTRGLTSVTCAALGFCANPTGNEAMLQELKEHFSWEELRASGLFLEADKKRKLGRRPNAQFHGKGQIGRKPDKERRGKDDKWVWGFGEPVLIPFFDEGGELLKLRPHKGGAPSGTFAGRPRIYVPRAYKICADSVEHFYEVIVCEGEYKAAAIWQTLGLGAKLQVDAADKPLFDSTRFEAVGVCALPGISYVSNVEMRMDLERWLKDVGCRRVLVAFDDEDKSDKPIRRRFDAQICARFLAMELSKNLHVEARVCVLPREWRNAHGKADWDGALVKLIQPTTETKV